MIKEVLTAKAFFQFKEFSQQSARSARLSPDNVPTPHYTCPVCGAELDGGDTIAEDMDGDAVGCIYCIRYYEIWEKDINEDII